MEGKPKTRGRASTLVELAKKSVTAWINDYAPSMGAALAYYTLFSLAPLLLLVISVASVVFGADAARGEVVAQFGSLIGKEGAVAIEGLLKSASQPAQNLTASAISVVTLIIGATSIFAELQSDLDRIWRVPAAKKPSGIWGMFRTRLLSFGLIMSLGFLLLVSLVVSAGLAAVGKWYGAMFPGWVITLQVVNQLVSLIFVTILFAMMYRVLPSVRVTWQDVWHGAVATGVLFTIGKFLIGMYLGKAGVASGFGAAGSIVALLVWVFYSAQIFLLGAEFTWLYAHSHGSRAGQGAEEGNAVAPTSPHRETAGPQNVPVPGHGRQPPRAARETTPVAPHAGARDFATAGLVWVGFGAVLSLLRARGSRKTLD
jgi:membrane protein